MRNLGPNMCTTGCTRTLVTGHRPRPTGPWYFWLGDETDGWSRHFVRGASGQRNRGLVKVRSACSAFEHPPRALSTITFDQTDAVGVRYRSVG